MKANLFFFVSTIGFALLSVLGILALYQFIRLLRAIRKTVEQLETQIHTASNEARLLIEDLRQSLLFRLLFGRSRKRRFPKREE